jgi:hypothetical protein
VVASRPVTPIAAADPRFRSASATIRMPNSVAVDRLAMKASLENSTTRAGDSVRS